MKARSSLEQDLMTTGPTTTRLGAICRLGAAVLMVAVPVGEARSQIVFADIGSFPGAFSIVARAMSADGQVVVGDAVTSVGTFGFRWTASEGFATLAAAQPGQPTHANGVSADGDYVTGHFQDASGSVACRWQRSGSLLVIGDLPGGKIQSFGNAVSASGVAVTGFASTVGGGRAFLWTEPTGIQDLGVPSGYSGSIGTGISVNGSVICGTLSAETQTSAFRWSPEAGMAVLETLPGGLFSSAAAISEDGSVIAGFSQSALGGRAVRWVAGQIEDLGTPEGASGASAVSISGDGRTIGGFAFPSTGLSEQATLWRDGFGSVNLNSYLVGLGVDLSGWHLSEVTGISRDGSSVVGTGLKNSVPRSFVIRGLQYGPWCYPNCDASTGSPALTPADFSCFLSRYREGDAYANCDGSTGASTLSPADFACFLARYRAGCV